MILNVGENHKCLYCDRQLAKRMHLDSNGNMTVWDGTWGWKGLNVCNMTCSKYYWRAKRNFSVNPKRTWS